MNRKKKLKPHLVLTLVLGTLSSSGLSKDRIHKTLDLFPAEYDGPKGIGGIRFLADNPVTIKIESYELHAAELRIDINVDEASRQRLAQTTEDYLQKHLAIVIDGAVVSAPVIKSRIAGGQLSISLASRESFDAVRRLVADE